jgi:AbiU2
MRTEQQIEVAAAAAAEKANGGKFADPLFYKPEHRAFWKDVIRTAFDAADAALSAGAASPTGAASPAGAASPTGAPSTDGPASSSNVSRMEVEEFSAHCVYIRSVYTLMMRIWRDSDDGERKVMEAVAPLFFEDMGKVLSEFLVIAACRITDPVNDRRGNQNFTLELFTNSFSPDSDTFKQLDALRQRIDKLRVKILPARNKLGAHADRTVILKGQPLGAASWKEWDDFWSALADFVRILNEKTTGKPFEIDAAGVLGDAETLLKALAQSQHFETLLNGNDPAVRDAYLKVALPDA